VSDASLAHAEVPLPEVVRRYLSAHDNGDIDVAGATFKPTQEMPKLSADPEFADDVDHVVGELVDAVGPGEIAGRARPRWS
jgi:hypothetical protein